MTKQTEGARGAPSIAVRLALAVGTILLVRWLDDYIGRGWALAVGGVIVLVYLLALAGRAYERDAPHRDAAGPAGDGDAGVAERDR